MDLDLGQNNCGSIGAEALANALSVNSTLIKLNICGDLTRPDAPMGIGEKGGVAIGRMIGVNKGLQILDISETSIGPLGVKAIGEGFRTNSSLTSLNCATFYEFKIDLKKIAKLEEKKKKEKEAEEKRLMEEKRKKKEEEEGKKEEETTTENGSNIKDDAKMLGEKKTENINKKKEAKPSPADSKKVVKDVDKDDGEDDEEVRYIFVFLKLLSCDLLINKNTIRMKMKRRVRVRLMM